MQTGSASISRAPRPSSLADVLDLILDKGLVIDAYVRISLAGIELVTVDARIVVASVDTYLRFAEAVNRLDLSQSEEQGLPALLGNKEQDGRSSSGNGGEARRKRPAQRDGGRQRGDGRTRELGRARELARARDAEHAGHTGGHEDGHDDGHEDEDAGLLGRITERARR